MDILNWWKGMENALDAAALRQEVISNNIANAGSPNFKTQAVAFEAELQKAMGGDSGLDVRPVSLEEDLNTNPNAKGDDKAWTKVRPRIEDTGQTADMNKEMVNLAKNQIHYNLLADKMGGLMSGITKCIDEIDRR